MSRALQIMLRSYKTLLNHFQHVDQTNSTAEVKGRASYMYLSKKLVDFRALWYMFLLMDILEGIGRLSLKFQNNSLTPADFLDALEQANLELLALIHEDGQHLQSFFVEIVDGKFQGVELSYYDPKEDNLKEKKRTAITKVREAINQRLEKENDLTRPVIAASRVFSPAEWPLRREELAVFGAQELTTLYDHFQSVLDRLDVNLQDLRREWQGLKVHLAAQYRVNKNVQELYAGLFRDENVAARFKNVLVLLEITLVIPMATAQVERGFSALKRIKSDWRSSLEKDMLNKLLLIVLEGPSFDDYLAELAVERWWQGGQRRRRPDFNLDNEDEELLRNLQEP